MLSPGISVNAPIAQMFYDQEKPVWSEIELAYQASKGKIAAITGTNGKTTTTALTGEIMKGYYESSFVVGNIGIPYTSVALDTQENSVITAEISRFQIETNDEIKPEVTPVLNITPDHLDRHGTVEVYAKTKESIGKNQTKDQIMVLNYEDDTTRDMATRANGKVLFFSLHHKIKEGVFMEDDAFVIEEGYPMEKLEEIATAMEKTAKEAGVHIVSGDTKVAGKGQVDGVFITTTGMGQIEEGVTVGGELAKPGDAIIVTGDIGRHGCTILLEREDFGIDADVTSDCAPLWNTVKAVMDTTHDLHVIRDATRGGVGTVLYEIAGQSNVGIRLNAEAVPVQPEVKGVCGMLGLEPLYLACEGRLVIMASKKEAEAIVETLKKCPYSANAAIIGEVMEEEAGRVIMETEIGTQALLPQPGGELLPRIC